MISFINFDSPSDVNWAISYLKIHKENGLSDDVHDAVNEYISNKAWHKQLLSDTVTKDLDVFVRRMYASYRRRLSRINRKSESVVNLEERSFTLKHDVHSKLLKLSTNDGVTMSQKITNLIDAEWNDHIEQKTK